MTTIPKRDLDTLLTIIYITLDDYLPQLIPNRRRPPLIPDATIICLAIGQALLKRPSERHFFRSIYRLSHLFPELPTRRVYNDRLKHLTPALHLSIQLLNTLLEADFDDINIVDSTVIMLARSKRPTTHSDFVGHARHGKRSSHQGFFWGMRLHLLINSQGHAICYELTDACTSNERPALIKLLEESNSEDKLVLADLGYTGEEVEKRVEATFNELILPRKAKKGGRRLPDGYKGTRQTIELFFGVLKEQLDLERLKAKSLRGLVCRVMQRLLALTAARYINHLAGDSSWSLISYDH